jgi:hypothetical protein
MRKLLFLVAMTLGSFVAAGADWLTDGGESSADSMAERREDPDHRQRKEYEVAAVSILSRKGALMLHGI